jgi:hypothetical protein
LVDYIAAYTEETKEILLFPTMNDSIRKKLHELLDAHAPWIGKTSLKSDLFPNYTRQVRLRCGCCGNGKAWRATYDKKAWYEAYFADCGDCGSHLYWEDGYNEQWEIVRVQRENCILMGRCFEHYANSRTGLSLKDRKKMLAEKKYLSLDREALRTELQGLFDAASTRAHWDGVPFKLTQDRPDWYSKADFENWLDEKLGKK